MASIQHPILIDRKKPFRPTVIKFLGFAVTIYNPPLTMCYLKSSYADYDRETAISKEDKR